MNQLNCLNELVLKQVDWEEADDLAQVAADVDVLYQTRIQKERFQVIVKTRNPIFMHIFLCLPVSRTALWVVQHH
jgi:aspartate carbamoyltransferase catalytic subunit